MLKFLGSLSMGVVQYSSMEAPPLAPDALAMPKTAPRRKNYIALWRRYRGNMRQEDLAHRIGMTPGNLSQLETGKINYTHETLGRIAEELETTRGDLLEVDPFERDQARDELDAVVEHLPADQRRRAARLLKAMLEQDQ
jgi:transcriptional regulator with XRE-family HTH domain